MSPTFFCWRVPARIDTLDLRFILMDNALQGEGLLWLLETGTNNRGRSVGRSGNLEVIGNNRKELIEETTRKILCRETVSHGLRAWALKGH